MPPLPLKLQFEEIKIAVKGSQGWDLRNLLRPLISTNRNLRQLCVNTSAFWARLQWLERPYESNETPSPERCSHEHAYFLLCFLRCGSLPIKLYVRTSFRVSLIVDPGGSNMLAPFPLHPELKEAWWRGQLMRNVVRRCQSIDMDHSFVDGWIFDDPIRGASPLLKTIRVRPSATEPFLRRHFC